MATNDVEWIGGRVKLPALVSGSGHEPIKPEAILWMLPSGIILGIDLLTQGEPILEIVQSFRRATQTPSKGEPCVPGRLRIADPELAQALRTPLKPATKVLCEPTPEFDVVAAAMVEHIADSQGPPTYVLPGVPSESLGAFFEAASRLFRAAPWKAIPRDRDVLSLSIPELGISNWVLSVIGQAGQSFGIVLFRSREDFWSFASAGFGVKVDDIEIPWSLSLSFHEKGELPPSLHQELATYGWKVAGPKAHPLLTVGDQREARPATAEELSVTIAVCNALALLTTTEPWLKSAWSDPRKAIARTLSVEIPTGPVQVALRAPYGLQDSPQSNGQGFDIYARVLDPQGGFEQEWFRSYCVELLRRFEASPEAKELERIDWTELLLNYGSDYLGVTVADMTPDILEELVFSVFPRKVSCNAKDASEIVREFRAFFAFLGREFRLGNAQGCLRVLEGAEARLRRELSNPKNFGMAKRFFLAGQQAGFDVKKEEGLQAWVRAANAQPDAFNPFGDGLPPEDRRRARNKRKKARQKLR